MKVLLADDDKLLIELLATHLRAKGCDVVSAVDAMQAFMTAMRAKPDVIVLALTPPRPPCASSVQRHTSRSPSIPTRCTPR